MKEGGGVDVTYIEKEKERDKIILYIRGYEEMERVPHISDDSEIYM